MKRQYIPILVMVLIGITSTVNAQFTLGGEVRPRAEYRDGFKTFNSSQTDAAFFIEQRTRIIASYQYEKVKFKLSLQDVRFWGGTSQIYKSDNALLNFNEAWASYDFGGGSSIKLGRQELDYDNARILGNLAWAQQSRSHDLVKYEYAGEDGFKLHAGVAFNQETVNAPAEPARLFGTFYSGVNNYKTMQFAWAHKSYDAGKISFLFLSNGLQNADSTVQFSYTTGTYWNQSLGALKLTFEGYYQFGEARDTDVNAYMLALALGIPMGDHNLTVGGDYLSGTTPGDTENNAFAPLFGTNHKFYGLMDYFFVGNSHGNIGLTDIYLKTNWKLGAKSNLLLHLHQFLTPVDVPDENGGTRSAELGREVDLVFNHNMGQGVNLKIGFSALDGTETLGEFKSGDPSSLNFWGWTMITFKPTFIKEK